MTLQIPESSEAEKKNPYKIGWLSTGRDPAARNLLTAVYERRCELGPHGVDISFVFCNYGQGENPQHRDYRERQEFFDLARGYRIPLIALPWRPFVEKHGEKWREPYGAEMNAALQGMPNNLDVCAGFMLWVPDNICTVRKMVNLHPALPDGPKGAWQEVIWQLMSEKAKETGAMMHRVTPDLDRGPVVTYCRFPVAGGDYDDLWRAWKTEEEQFGFDGAKARYPDFPFSFAHPLFRQIRQDGEARELPLTVHTIGEFARHNVWIEGDSVMSRDGALKGGYDITDLVESGIR